jgi:hypothetical protein
LASAHSHPTPAIPSLTALFGGPYFLTTGTDQDPSRERNRSSSYHLNMALHSPVKVFFKLLVQQYSKFIIRTLRHYPHPNTPSIDCHWHLYSPCADWQTKGASGKYQTSFLDSSSSNQMFNEEGRKEETSDGTDVEKEDFRSM